MIGVPPLLRHISIAIALLAGGYFIIYAHRHISNLPDLTVNTQTTLVVLATIVLYSMNIVIGGTIWHLILRFYGEDIRWYRTQKIYGQAQFGKYIPGNIGHHVGRVVLARDNGVTMPVVLQSMLVETAWGTAAGLGLAILASIYVLAPGTIAGSETLKFVEIFSLFIVSLLLPYALLKLVNMFFPELSSRLSGTGQLKLPDLGTLLQVMVLSFITYLTIGVVLDVHARYLFGFQDSNILFLTGVFFMGLDSRVPDAWRSCRTWCA